MTFTIFILLFIIIGIPVRTVVRHLYLKNTSEKERRRGESKLVYWQIIIYTSMGLTFLLILLLQNLEIIH